MSRSETKKFESQMVKDHLKASKKLMKEISKDKESAIKFLQDAGILNRNGKLAKPYR